MTSGSLALLGGVPVRSEPWPVWPVFDAAEEAALLAVLHNREWGGYPTPNEHAEHFARAFAERHDCEYGLCVANGTVSLEVALQALGVEPGAEVIVPAYTFEATAAAVLFAGCVPVFADIDSSSYCLDPESFEERITSSTQAVVPVHLGMRFADMDRIVGIADHHGIRIVEDCAHAHGGRWRDRGAGSFGAAGSFSFQTSKLMSAGEGGIVVTNDTEVLDRLFALTNCGRQRPQGSRHHFVVGHNYRMTDFQAAILQVQLERLDEQHEKRNRNASRLDQTFETIDGFAPLDMDSRITRPALYQYVLRYDSRHFEDLPREAVVAALAAEGVPCDGRFYECLTDSEMLPLEAQRFPEFARRSQAPCPTAEHAAWSEAIWIPHPVFLADEADLDQIPEAIEKIRSRAEDLRGLEHPAIEAQRVVRARRPPAETGAKV